MIQAQERSITIKLKKEWMGHHPGTVMPLPRMVAESLVSRHTAVICNDREEISPVVAIVAEKPKLSRRTTPRA